MAHRRAMLTRFGRLLVVQRVGEMNWAVAPMAALVNNFRRKYN